MCGTCLYALKTIVYATSVNQWYILAIVYTHNSQNPFAKLSVCFCVAILKQEEIEIFVQYWYSKETESISVNLLCNGHSA